VRVIIPGYIGGRMVKWLKSITVTAEESTNFYHYFDNRVFPSHVTADIAEKETEKWWKHPDVRESYFYCSHS
jgi:nitrate reductase (NAD(P)H)